MHSRSCGAFLAGKMFSACIQCGRKDGYVGGEGWREGGWRQARDGKSEYAAIYMSICIKHPIIFQFKYAKKDENIL